MALEGLRLDEDEQFGVTIVRRACEEPVRQIVSNGGLEGSIVVSKIKASTDPNFGFNASTDEYEDLIAAGVLDPTKVTRTALQNARRVPYSYEGRTATMRKERVSGALCLNDASK